VCNRVIIVSDFQSPPEEVTAAVDVALEMGYRHIDTAFMYQNEAAIGKTLKKWFDSGKLKREDVFIVTKVSKAHKYTFTTITKHWIFMHLKLQKYMCTSVLKSEMCAFR
jgi:diketogulonate reductase-like aldo/keto reductase